MKTKRFDFNFKPLQLDVSLSVDGSVPDRQNYDADNDEFTPDYTITPLILQPRVDIMDKDEIMAAGNVNHQLTNIRWYVVENGTRTQIESTYNANTNPYSYVTSGSQAGRLSVQRNATANSSFTLEFYAEYLDSRTNQVYPVQLTHLVKCDNSTAYIPLLVLDAADETVYNPLTDTASQTVHASLKLGAGECPASKRIFVWEISRDGTTWGTVGNETTLDYMLTVANDGTSCTVNRSLMGTELFLRCRAKYDINGNPASVTLNAAAPCKAISFVRRIPKYEYDFALPTNIPAGTLTVCPEPFIWDVNGPVENPQNVLLPIWYMATNRASGSLTYQQVAHGYAPSIPTALMSTIYGGVIGIDVIDPGPACAWEDSDGAVFLDGDGNVLLIN